MARVRDPDRSRGVAPFTSAATGGMTSHDTGRECRTARTRRRPDPRRARGVSVQGTANAINSGDTIPTTTCRFMCARNSPPTEGADTVATRPIATTMAHPSRERGQGMPSRRNRCAATTYAPRPATTATTTNSSTTRNPPCRGRASAPARSDRLARGPRAAAVQQHRPGDHDDDGDHVPCPVVEGQIHAVDAVIGNGARTVPGSPGQPGAVGS